MIFGGVFLLSVCVHGVVDWCRLVVAKEMT